ncbi:hypothetical protein PIB30_088732 [Stylosanthes scabra]|uniref:Aminotransferase-like plant mobile domain-containing protein n=1 Tax=Stylosanthes scabra TaxID=79078 RepID=A0ABU6XUY5_9FABA|nr:hypothetical protein [Stylosanthes scabra]
MERRTWQVPRLPELRPGSVIVPPPPAIISHVRDVGFEDLLMMRVFDIDGPLLSSFVEHWWLETHTFHLSFGEATIPL